MYQFQYDIKPGRYRHFKGNEYQVIGMARHSETEEEMVVYRPLYGEGGLWVRPAAMWAEEVERDGKRQPRFAYIGECKGLRPEAKRDTMGFAEQTRLRNCINEHYTYKM